MACLKQLVAERDNRCARYQVFEFYRHAGMSLERHGQVVAARAMLSLSADRLDEQFGSNDLGAQQALNVLALHDYNVGDFASALSAFERLHAGARQAWGAADRLTRMARVRVWQCRRRLRSSSPVPPKPPR